MWWIPCPSAAILVDREGAEALVARGAAVLDARSVVGYLSGHIPGAVRVPWSVGVEPGLTTGKIRDPVATAAALASAGVDADEPVLVVGAWDRGWGEEGRLAWVLTWLGHADVHVLRGGIDAWRNELALLPSRQDPGTFTARVRPELRVDARSLRNDPDAWTVVDVRTAEEFAGATPYGEARGGHLPGATNIPWTRFLAVTPDLPRERTIAVYCTGGVRSGFAWMMLTDAGYPVANYDGSWWEWARLYDAD